MGVAAVATESPPTINQISRYLKEHKLSIKQLAREVNYSSSTLSRYLAGKYEADASKIETKLEAFLKKAESADNVTPFPQKPAKRTDFFKTNDVRSALGVCRVCQQKAKLGVITGRIGFGKTLSIKQYAALERVKYIRCDSYMSGSDLLKAIEKAVGMPRFPQRDSFSDRVNMLRGFFRTNKGYLLIFDEAQRLISGTSSRKIGIIQDIYDESDVGVVLAGEPKLKALLKQYQEQTAERIRYHADLQGLNRKEMTEYLHPYNITPDALDALWNHINTPQGGGCFRLLDGILENALDLTQDSVITLDVITEAAALRWQ